MSSGRIKNAVLRVGEELKVAECGFATEADAEVVARWEQRFSGNINPVARDAAEFAALASKRWHYYRQQAGTVGSIDELRQKIAEDPKTEVAMMAVVRADWFSEDSVLGVCHFRRTWCNNLFVDFLTAQPEIASRSGTRVSGVGTWLLAIVADVAVEIQAPAIWGETTKESAAFYKKTLDLRDETDEFRLPRRRYRAFLGQTRSKHTDELIARNRKWIAEARELGILPASWPSKPSGVFRR